MKITILAVGKIKEDHFVSAVKEYGKRLKPYCSLKIIELKDEKTPQDPSEREKELVLQKEEERIAEKLPQDAYLVLLDPRGKEMTSEKFALFMEELPLKGFSHLCFVIGGSMGLAERLKTKAHLLLSFSKFTFPHQLFRVILLEQIYRGFKIIKNEPYHK